MRYLLSGGFRGGRRSFSLMQESIFTIFPPNRSDLKNKPQRQEDDSRCSVTTIQSRPYSTSLRHDFLAVASFAVIGALGYVVYKKCRGEDLTPDSAKQAQDAYKKFHAKRTNGKSDQTNSEGRK